MFLFKNGNNLKDLRVWYTTLFPPHITIESSAPSMCTQFPIWRIGPNCMWLPLRKRNSLTTEVKKSWFDAPLIPTNINFQCPIHPIEQWTYRKSSKDPSHMFLNGNNLDLRQSSAHFHVWHVACCKHWNTR